MKIKQIFCLYFGFFLFKLIRLCFIIMLTNSSFSRCRTLSGAEFTRPNCCCINISIILSIYYYNANNKKYIYIFNTYMYILYKIIYMIQILYRYIFEIETAKHLNEPIDKQTITSSITFNYYQKTGVFFSLLFYYKDMRALNHMIERKFNY